MSHKDGERRKGEGQKAAHERKKELLLELRLLEMPPNDRSQGNLHQKNGVGATISSAIAALVIPQKPLAPSSMSRVTTYTSIYNTSSALQLPMNCHSRSEPLLLVCLSGEGLTVIGHMTA